MELNKYKNIWCNGKKVDLGKAFGRAPQLITQMYNKEEKWLVVIEGNKHHLVEIKATRIVSESND